MLVAAAAGRFPPADGGVVVAGSPPGRADAVVAFTAHHVVATALAPEQVRRLLPGDRLSGPMQAHTVAAIGDTLGVRPGSLDVVLAAPAVPGPPRLLRAGSRRHARVARARRHRDDVAVFGDDDGAVVVTLGRGLARRWEVSLEVDASRRGEGLGRRAIVDARRLLPAGTPLFAQVAPGNAASLRAFLAAGFVPLCAEVLFVREQAREVQEAARPAR